MDAHCYCEATLSVPSMIECQICKKYFHPECFKSGRPSHLEGDIYFKFTCEKCASDGVEEVKRVKLQWLQIVILSLYNLQLSSSGKCGYFRWKEQICLHIEKHWNLYFGSNRKKSGMWFGTVAGVLSSCPHIFQSGTKELLEQGWWKLIENKPPSLQPLCMSSAQRQQAKKMEPISVDTTPVSESLRSRRARPSSIQSAMELKAKRATTQESKEIRKLKLSPVSDSRQRSQSESVSPKPMEETVEQKVEQSPVAPPKSIVPRKIFKKNPVAARRKSKPRVVTVMPVETSPVATQAMDASTDVTISDDHEFTFSEISPNAKNVSEESESLLLPEGYGSEGSDLDVDPCSISPLVRSSHQSMLSSQQNLINVDDIMSNLTGSSPVKIKSEFGQKIPTSKEQIDTCTIKAMTVDELAPFTILSKPDILPQVTTEPVDKPVKKKTKKDVEEEEESEDEESNSNESESEDEENDNTIATNIKNKKTEKLNDEESQSSDSHDKIEPLSFYEEKQLLHRLQDYGAVVTSNPTANRLKRKLIVRQLKRDRNIYPFDLDSEVTNMLQARGLLSLKDQNRIKLDNWKVEVPTMRYTDDDFRVLDRFQVSSQGSWCQPYQPRLFLNRLVGSEDDQLLSKRSPYTARLLKPFIRRDYETKTKKMKLLYEIQSHYHSDNPTWTPAPQPPIDYCYVQPQHIPSINALCREFFWPGIDMSECLQYPDFSCVALYRQFVVGFAFLVPDMKYNEAYISFIFTHPEWRVAGIATFMLYHLIQTCMGKDITLHVSASNPAMLLYQKFGFKPEEFILDFYDKYFPVDSKECRHAFYLRLKR